MGMKMLSGSAQLPTPVALHSVHAGIGGADDGVQRASVRWSGCQSDTGAHVQMQSILHVKAGVHQRAMELCGQDHRGFRASLRHKDYEFVASIAEAPVL